MKKEKSKTVKRRRILSFFLSCVMAISFSSSYLLAEAQTTSQEKSLISSEQPELPQGESSEVPESNVSQDLLVSSSHPIEDTESDSEFSMPEGEKPNFSHPVINEAAVPLDMNPFIREMNIMKKVNGTYIKIENIEEDIFDEDEIKVLFDFVIPAQTATKENKTFTFQLPTDGMLWTEVTDGELEEYKQAVADYTVKDNLLTITYRDEFIEKKELSPIWGSFFIEGKAELQEEGTPGKEVVFGETGYHFTIKPTPEEKKWDLKAEKWGSVQNKTASYTVKISTQKGTKEEIDIKDSLDSVKARYIENSFKMIKRNADGAVDSTFSAIPEIIQENGKPAFQYLNLPKLESKESYEITYEVKIDADFFTVEGKPINGVKKLKNKIVAESGPHKDERDFSVDFRNQIIQKEGTAKVKDNKIIWTITINREKADISGWVLTDEMTLPSGQKIELKDVKGVLKDSSGNIIDGNVSFPYTFPAESNDTYTLTYETALGDLGHKDSEKYQNKITITDGENEYQGDKTVTVTADHQTKTAQKETEDIPGADAEKYIWQTVLKIPKGGLPANLSSYKDVAGEHLYFTGDTFEVGENTKEFVILGKNIEQEVRLTEGVDYDLVFYEDSEKEENSYTMEDLKNNKALKAKAFKILFLKDIDETKVQELHFSYGTYADYSWIQDQNNKTFINKAFFTINGKTEVDQAQKNYSKKYSLLKQASPNGEKHTYTNQNLNLKYQEIDNQLYYRLLVNMEKNQKGKLLITDTLPAGTTLVKDSFAAFFYDNDYYEHKGYNVKIDDLVQWEVKDNQLFIEVEKGYEGNALVFYYTLSIEEDESWQNHEQTSKIYRNKAEQGDSTAEHETEVTRNNKVIEKTGDSSQKDIIDYRVTINPLGKDLDKSADTLTMTDYLRANLQAAKKIELLKDSVKLYRYDSQAKENHYRGEELGEREYGYVYDGYRYTTTFTLPDSTPLVLEYSYYFEAVQEEGEVTVSNTVELKGLGKDHGDEAKNTVKTSASGGTSYKAQVTLYKVDSEDYQKLLPGAEFSLYQTTVEEYRKNKEWQLVSDNLISDEKGEIHFVPKMSTKSGSSAHSIERSSQILYRLVETKAPEGYQLNENNHFYFVWLPDSEQNIEQTVKQITERLIHPINELSKPEEQISAGQVRIFLNTGGEMYITNAYENLTVEKFWEDEFGNPLTPQTKEIEVKLYRQSKKTVGHKVKVTAGSPNTKTSAEQTIYVKDGSDVTIHIAGNYYCSDWKAIKNGEFWQNINVGNQKDFSYTITDIQEDAEYRFEAMNWFDWIDLQLSGYQKAEESEGEKEEVDLVTLRQENNWKYSWSNLEIQDKDGNPYFYFAEEVNVPAGFKVEYRNNGIFSGGILILNIWEKTHAKLPETGGDGQNFPMLAGVMMMSFSTGVYCKIRRKKQNADHQIK